MGTGFPQPGFVEPNAVDKRRSGTAAHMVGV
jgi:hypothetical protein